MVLNYGLRNTNHQKKAMMSSKLWARSIGVVPLGEKTGQIRFLLVGSQFRSCELGQRLIDTALDYCRAEGYKVAADRKSTRLNSSHEWISYAVFCLKKKRR